MPSPYQVMPTRPESDEAIYRVGDEVPEEEITEEVRKQVNDWIDANPMPGLKKI